MHVDFSAGKRQSFNSQLKKDICMTPAAVMARWYQFFVYVNISMVFS